MIARNSDLFIALFTPVAIGWSNYFGIGVWTAIRKPLYAPQEEESSYFVVCNSNKDSKENDVIYPLALFLAEMLWLFIYNFN